MKLWTSLAVLLLVGGNAPAEPLAPKPVHFAVCTQAGVEHGCVIARGDDGALYNVTGALPGLKPHDWLQGTASVSERVSYCMQGRTIAGFQRDQNQAAANCGAER
jgi:hypothetical protein